MSGMREGAVRIAPRRYRRRRPSWQLPVAIAAAVVVVLLLVYGIVRMFSGSSEPETSPAAPTPLPCATVLVSPAESLPAPERVRVNVYNGTQKPGLAGTTAQVLRARGFVIRDVGNAPGKRQVAGLAEILYGPKGKPSAELLEYYFPGAVLIADGRGRRVVDVVLGAKFTAVVDDASVAAAKASPTPSPSGSGCATTQSPTQPAAASAPAGA